MTYIRSPNPARTRLINLIIRAVTGRYDILSCSRAVYMAIDIYK